MVCACVHVMEKDCTVAKPGTRKYGSCTKFQEFSLLIFFFRHIIRFTFQNNIMQEIVLFIFHAVNEQFANISIANTGLLNSFSSQPRFIGPYRLRMILYISFIRWKSWQKAKIDHFLLSFELLQEDLISELFNLRFSYVFHTVDK